MVKSIYKITNKLNGKCYIGQTTDPKRRFREHKNLGYEQDCVCLLQYAIKKYGLENFSFEVIESNIENYNEREKQWIRFYNSYEDGQNLTEGGDTPPLHIKEQSPFATHTQEEVNVVINLLLNTNKNYDEIAQMTGYDRSAIQRINNGILWHNNSLDYPLRKETSSAYRIERCKNIIQDLLNTNLTQKQIAEKYNCARSTVTAINNGQNQKQEDLTYPLRKIKNDIKKPVSTIPSEIGSTASIDTKLEKESSSNQEE